MMFGHPKAAVTKTLGGLGEVAGVIERNPGIAAFGNRRKVEDGQGDHREHMGGDAPICTRLPNCTMKG